MSEYRFKQVDVFTDRPFLGNPVAVVLEAGSIPAEEMQRIARWTNLSETTFVLKPTVPGADYRLRIFTPAGELPFAGHPTIGSAHAVIEAGLVDPGTTAITQECAAGLLPLTVTPDGEIRVRVPQPKVVPLDPGWLHALTAALGTGGSSAVPPAIVDVGPVWLIAFLEDPDALRNLSPDLAAVAILSRQLGLSGITIFSRSAEPGAQVHVRSFAPAAGVPEDPVCGSGNACVGAYLAHSGLIREIGTDYAASQGSELGRDGRVLVSVTDGGRTVTIGGRAVTVIDGHLRL